MAIARPRNLPSQMVVTPDERRVCPAEDELLIGFADAASAPVGSSR
jgi:hypothetical protein